MARGGACPLGWRPRGICFGMMRVASLSQVFGALAFFAAQVAGFGLILWTWPSAGLALLFWNAFTVLYVYCIQ